MVNSSGFVQIRFFLLQNKQGKTRLTKWYISPPDEADRLKMESDIHRVIMLRDKKHTNFIEVKLLSNWSLSMDFN